MDSNERLFKYFLAWLLLFGAIIIGILNMPSLADAKGIIHPEYSTMLHSGTSVSVNGTTKLISACYGLGIIGILTFAILIATNRRTSPIRKSIQWKVVAGGLLYMLVFLAMIQSYWQYSATGEATYFLGFPAPTAWMLFGMWAVPLFFTFFYIFRFDSWVLSQEEEDRFHKIVKDRKARQLS